MRSAALLTLLLFAACAHTAVSPDAASNAETGAISDRLFCGLSISGGGTVSEAELDAFIRDEVETRFPGFTVWRARGHWRGGNEEVVIIEIVRPRDEAQARAVAKIAEAYRDRFRQQTVLRVMTPAAIEWISAPRP